MLRLLYPSVKEGEEVVGVEMGERETETERYSGGGRWTKLSAGFRRHACPTLSSFPCYSVLDFGE